MQKSVEIITEMLGDHLNARKEITIELNFAVYGNAKIKRIYGCNSGLHFIG